MTKLKCQIKLKTLNNDKGQRGIVLAFKHLDLNCHLDFDIWVYLELRGAKQMGSQKTRRIFGVKINPYEQD